MQTHGTLGATFHISRLFQGISLITIIGLTAHFISDIISANATPPTVLIGIISVASIATLYSLITTILLLDDILPFLLCAGLDLCFLIALIVVSVLIGRPLSYLQCSNLSTPATGAGTSAMAFTAHLKSYIQLSQGGVGSENGRVRFADWMGVSKAVCLEGKVVWGVCIALCILFFFSAVCAVCLWRRGKAVAKRVEDA